MAKWLLIAFLSLAPSAVAIAQVSGKSPTAQSTSDSAVDQTFDSAYQNRPGANGPAKAPSTLDDYAQQRWTMKLGTIVPVVLLATPVILGIVLLALRFGGVRSPEHIMLASALVLVIQATLIVSLTAEGSDALSASMGILGAIAGYLFGRSRQEPLPSEPVTHREAVAPRPDAVQSVDERRAA